MPGYSCFKFRAGMDGVAFRPRWVFMLLLGFAVIVASQGAALAATSCYVDQYGDHVCDGPYTPPSSGSGGSAGGSSAGPPRSGGGPIFLPGGRRRMPVIDTSADSAMLFFRRENGWHQLQDFTFRRGSPDIVAFSAPAGTKPTDYGLFLNVVQMVGNKFPKIVIRDSSGTIVAERRAVEVANLRVAFSDTGTLSDADLAANPSLRFYTILRAGETYTFEGSVTSTGGEYGNTHWFRMGINKHK